MMTDKEREIISDYLSGMKSVDIVKKHKVSSATVSKILKQNGITTRYKKEKSNSDNIYNEITLFNSTFEDVSKRYGCTVSEAKKTYRSERDKKIIKAYKNGKNFDDICKEFNLSNMAVYKILDKNNIPRRRDARNRSITKTALNEELKKQILDDYNKQNIPVKILLEKYNITRSQLYQLLHVTGATMRGKEVLSDERKKQIKAEYESGKTITEISRENKTSRALISYVVKGS